MRSRRRFAPVAVAVAAVVLGACAGGSPAHVRPQGTLTGTVLMAPTCPVEVAGQPCDPSPVIGSVELHLAGDKVAQTAISADGTFELRVPTGSYTLVIDTGGSAFPACPTTEVVVVADARPPVQIMCDTGIR